jgi:hypothetical protein
MFGGTELCGGKIGSNNIDTSVYTWLAGHGYSDVFGEMVVNLIQQLQSTRSLPSKVPVVKVMRLCEKDRF